MSPKKELNFCSQTCSFRLRMYWLDIIGTNEGQRMVGLEAAGSGIASTYSKERAEDLSASETNTRILVHLSHSINWLAIKEIICDKK